MFLLPLAVGPYDRIRRGQVEVDSASIRQKTVLKIMRYIATQIEPRPAKIDHYMLLLLFGDTGTSGIEVPCCWERRNCWGGFGDSIVSRRQKTVHHRDTSTIPERSRREMFCAGSNIPAPYRICCAVVPLRCRRRFFDH